MSIRAFLYSRRTEKASKQTQWPSAILLLDNDPDTGALPVSQTSNKAKHSLSSTNNLHTAAGVMDRPASPECEKGNKALGGQEMEESILFIDLRRCTAWRHMVITTFFLFISKTHKDKDYCRKRKKKNSAKHFTLALSHSINPSGGLVAVIHIYDHSHTHTHLQGWYLFRG